MTSPLEKLPLGRIARVCHMGERCECANALRKLGVVEGAEVQVVSQGNPLIIQCGHTRVAVCRKMLEGVLVHDDCGCPEEKESSCCKRQMGEIKELMELSEPASPQRGSCRRFLKRLLGGQRSGCASRKSQVYK